MLPLIELIKCWATLFLKNLAYWVLGFFDSPVHLKEATLHGCDLLLNIKCHCQSVFIFRREIRQQGTFWNARDITQNGIRTRRNNRSIADRWQCTLERLLADGIDNLGKAKLLATDRKHWKDRRRSPVSEDAANLDTVGYCSQWDIWSGRKKRLISFHWLDKPHGGMLGVTWITYRSQYLWSSLWHGEASFQV